MVLSKPNLLPSWNHVLTPASRDMIDFEKFIIKGNVFKMLLGSFIKEMDYINNETKDVLSPNNDLQSIKTLGPIPIISLLPWSIHGMLEEIS